MLEITYTKRGAYYFPNIVMDEQPKESIGKYGRMRRTYLKEHKPGVYQALLLQTTLMAHLLETDNAARELLEQLMEKIIKTSPPPDKATDQLGWEGHMNNLKRAAEEVVFAEPIYK